jgi:hypothetical protein
VRVSISRGRFGDIMRSYSILGLMELGECGNCEIGTVVKRSAWLDPENRLLCGVSAVGVKYDEDMLDVGLIALKGSESFREGEMALGVKGDLGVLGGENSTLRSTLRLLRERMGRSRKFC